MVPTSSDVDQTTAPAVSATAVAPAMVFGSAAATFAGIVSARSVSTAFGAWIAGLGILATLIYLGARLAPRVRMAEDTLATATITLYLLVALVPVSLNTTIIGRVGIDDLPTVVATLMALVWLWLNRRSIVVPSVVIPLVLLVGWIAIATLLVGVTAGSVVAGPARWGMYAVMCLAGYAWFQQRSLRRWFVASMLTIAAAQALFSIWSYHANWYAHNLFIGIEPFRTYQPLFDVVNGRTTGLLGIASNFFGGYVIIPAFIALGVAAATRDRWMRWSMVGLYAILAYAGILSYTRATLIGIALGMIGFVIFARPRIVGLAAIALTVLAVVSTPLISRFEEGNDRLKLSTQAGDTIASNPFVGVGSGQYNTHDTDDSGGGTVTPHNSFLLMASEVGVVGGALLLAAVGFVLAAAWGGGIPRTSGPGVLATAAFAGLGAVLVQTLSNNLLHIPPVATQFWLTGAAAAGWALDAGGSWTRRLVEPLRKGHS